MNMVNIDRLNEIAKTEYFFKRNLIKTVVKLGGKILESHTKELKFEGGALPLSPIYKENGILKWDRRFPRTIEINESKYFTKTYMQFLKETREQRETATRKKIEDRAIYLFSEGKGWARVETHKRAIYPMRKRGQSKSIFKLELKPTYKVIESKYKRASVESYIKHDYLQVSKIEQVSKRKKPTYWQEKREGVKKTKSNSQRYYDIILVENETFYNIMNSFKGRKKEESKIIRVLNNRLFIGMNEVYKIMNNYNNKIQKQNKKIKKRNSNLKRGEKKEQLKTISVKYRVSPIDTKANYEVNKRNGINLGQNGFSKIGFDGIVFNNGIPTKGSDRNLSYLEQITVLYTNNKSFKNISEVLNIETYDKIIDREYESFINTKEEQERERAEYKKLIQKEQSKKRMQKMRERKKEENITNIMKGIYEYMNK